MSDTELDQSRIYREYFGLVQEFNSANDKFVMMLNEAEQNRQRAIEQAIKEYLNPLITKFQVVQAITVIMTLASAFFLFNGFAVLLNDSKLWGIGLLVVLGSLVGGLIDLLGLVWASAKVSKLYADEKQAKQNLPKLPF